MVVELRDESTRSTPDRSRLERRRDKRNAAALVVSEAQVAERAVDRELAKHAGRLRELKRLLRSQRAQLQALKKSIKQLEKRGEKLRDERQSVKKNNSKAHKKLQSAEAKYERSVMDEMVRREKNVDLAEHGASRVAATRGALRDRSPAAAAITAAERN
jgi:septal ring factor EnvC (AmiA/AmiB activator)